MKILIVEDEMIISEDVCMILEENEYEVTDQVVDYEGAIESISQNRPDLVLLDINLRGVKDGIDVAQWIKDNHQIPFIFTSSLGDRATIQRAKATNPSGYMVKPFKEEQILATIEVAISNFNQNSDSEIREEEKIALINDAIFVKHHNRYVKVGLNEIMYIEKADNYLIIHTSANKFMIRASISSFMDQLPNLKLVRTHKSYAVNFEYVTDIGANYVMLNTLEVPLSKTYSDDIRSNLSMF